MGQDETEGKTGASPTLGCGASPLTQTVVSRSRPGTGSVANQSHRATIVDEANSRSDMSSLHILGERIATPPTRSGGDVVRLGSAHGVRLGSAASQRPRCEPRPTAVIPCSPELTPMRSVTKERRTHATPGAMSDVTRSGAGEDDEKAPIAQDRAERPLAAIKSPRAGRRRGGAHTLLLRQTYNGKTKVLFEDGSVKEYASDHVDRRIAGRLSSHSTTSKQVAAQQRRKQTGEQESNEGQHYTVDLREIPATAQLGLPEVLPAVTAHDTPFNPPPTTTPPPSARSTSATSQEPPSVATTPARTSRASSQQTAALASPTLETSPREAESLSWVPTSAARGVVVVMTPPLPSYDNVACAADEEQPSAIHVSATGAATVGTSDATGQTRSAFLTGVEVGGTAQPMPRPSSLIATRSRGRLSSLAQQQQQQQHRPAAHVMADDPEEMAQLRAAVRQVRAARRAAAQRFLQPDAPSLFSIPLPPMPTSGADASLDGETDTTAVKGAAALRLPYGLIVFDLFQRLVAREQGALRSKLSGLDITRFMQQSNSASELVVHFFWYVVVHCRRAWLERLLVGRHGRLVAAYQELFAQGRKERLPSLHVLESLVQELLCCTEAWQRHAQEWVDNSTTMTSLLQAPSMSGQPLTTLSPRPGSMSTAVRYKGMQRIYDFLVEGGYTTMLSLPKLYSGGSLPEAEAVNTLCATLDRLQCARSEYNELMTYSEYLYRRMASLFGDIFLQLSSSEKDVILESYGIVVVRITYYTLLLCFPNDTHANLFHADFRADLSRLYHYWTSGLVETHVPVRGWPMPQPEDFAELTRRRHQWADATMAVMPSSAASMLLLPALTSRTGPLSRGDVPGSASDAASIELTGAVPDVGRPASSRHGSASNTGERADEAGPDAAASWVAEGPVDSVPQATGTTALLPALVGSSSPLRRRHTQTMTAQQQGCSVATPRATSWAREDVDFDEIDPNVAHGECRLTSEFARYARHAAGLVLELERRTTRQHRRQMRKLQRPRRSLMQSAAQPPSTSTLPTAGGPHRQQSGRRLSQITLDVQLLSSPVSPGEQNIVSPVGSDMSTVAPRPRDVRSARMLTTRCLSQPTELTTGVTGSHAQGGGPTGIAASTTTTAAANAVAATVATAPPASHHASMSTQSVASSSLLSRGASSRRGGECGGHHRRVDTQVVEGGDEGGALNEGSRVILPAVTSRVAGRRLEPRAAPANTATHGSTSWTPRQRLHLPSVQYTGGNRHNLTSATAARGAMRPSASPPETRLHEKLQAVEVKRARISVTKDTVTTDLVRLASTLKQQSTMPVHLRGATGMPSVRHGSAAEVVGSHGAAAVTLAGSNAVHGEGLFSATPDDGCASLLTSFPLALCESGTRAYLMYTEGVRYPSVPLPSAVATVVLQLQHRLGGIMPVNLSRPVSSTRPTTASSSLTTHMVTAPMMHVLANSTLDFNNTLYTEDTYEDVHRAEDWAESVAAAVTAALKRSTVVRRTRLPSASPFMRHYATNVLHLTSYTTGSQDGGECASRHGGRAVQQVSTRHSSPLSDDEDEPPRATLHASCGRRQRTFRGVGRATRERTRLQVITREDGLHRPLLYTKVGKQALAQQKALLQDMGRVTQRDSISRHAYTVNHIKTVCDMRETSSDAATLRYRRIARHRLELRLVDTATEGVQELVTK